MIQPQPLPRSLQPFRPPVWSLPPTWLAMTPFSPMALIQQTWTQPAAKTPVPVNPFGSATADVFVKQPAKDAQPSLASKKPAIPIAWRAPWKLAPKGIELEEKYRDATDQLYQHKSGWIGMIDIDTNGNDDERWFRDEQDFKNFYYYGWEDYW